MAARRGAEAPVTMRVGYAELLRLYPPPDRQLLLLAREFAPPPVTRAVSEVPLPTELLSRTERVRPRNRFGSLSQAGATVTPCASTAELPSPTGPAEAGLRSGTGLGCRNSCSRPIRARSNRSSSCHWRYRPTPNYRHWRYRMDESSRHERDPRERQVLLRRGFRMPEQWDVRPHPTIPAHDTAPSRILSRATLDGSHLPRLQRVGSPRSARRRSHGPRPDRGAWERLLHPPPTWFSPVRPRRPPRNTGRTGCGRRILTVADARQFL